MLMVQRPVQNNEEETDAAHLGDGDRDVHARAAHCHIKYACRGSRWELLGSGSGDEGSCWQGAPAVG